MACHTANLAFMALQLGLPERVSAKSGRSTPRPIPPGRRSPTSSPARGSLPPVKLTWYEGAKDGKRNLPAGRPLPQGLQAVGQRLAVHRLAGPDVLAQRLRRGAGALARGEVQGPQGPRAHPPAHRGRADDDDNQKREWVAAIRAGKPEAALSNFDYAATLTEAMLLGNVAVRSGEAFHYDPRLRPDHRQPQGAPATSSPTSARDGSSEYVGMNEGLRSPPGGRASVRAGLERRLGRSLALLIRVLIIRRAVWPQRRPDLVIDGVGFVRAFPLTRDPSYCHPGRVGFVRAPFHLNYDRPGCHPGRVGFVRAVSLSGRSAILAELGSFASFRPPDQTVVLTELGSFGLAFPWQGLVPFTDSNNPKTATHDPMYPCVYSWFSSVTWMNTDKHAL